MRLVSAVSTAAAMPQPVWPRSRQASWETPSAKELRPCRYFTISSRVPMELFGGGLGGQERWSGPPAIEVADERDAVGRGQ